MLLAAQTRACYKDNGNSRAFTPLATAGERLGCDADCYRRNTLFYKMTRIVRLRAAGRWTLLVCFASSFLLLSPAVAKAKSPSARPSVPSHRRAPAPNPRLDLQTRKVLQKHYRARHGVK